MYKYKLESQHINAIYDKNSEMGNDYIGNGRIYFFCIKS